MKKSLLISLVVLLFSVCLLAQSSPFVSLNAAAATGAGSQMGQTSDYVDYVTWQATFTGTPTAITINLEGSIDGTNWFTLDSIKHTDSDYSAANGTMHHIVNKPVNYLRANISTYTVNGSTCTVTFRAWRKK